MTARVDVGFELLEVTNVAAEGKVFDLVPAPLTVPGNDSASVFVTFASGDGPQTSVS